jgi:uncharacterized membrane protein
MKIVIVIICITLIVSYYLNLQLQRRRNERNRAHQEKRKDAYIDLLSRLKEKEIEKDNTEKKDNV